MQACNLHSLFPYRFRQDEGCGGLILPVVCTITDCWRGTEWLSRAGLLSDPYRTAWLLPCGVLVAGADLLLCQPKLCERLALEVT
jgi:hypothetical protein